MFCQKCGTKNPDNGKFCRSCGMDLAGMSAPKAMQLKTPDFHLDRKGRLRSNDPDELWSSGIKNTISGVGFLIVALVLFLTNVAGGSGWWWAMLFPGFSLLANGVGSISKAKRLEKKNLANIQHVQPMLFNQPPTKFNLPPAQQEYIKPQKSIYDTGELVVPPSVTEGTTRHLEINKEGETMTLPKKTN